jgi:hypothetical protein
MWRPVCPILATTSLLVISAAAAHAQALAPSTLDFTSHDQKTANDIVQVITNKRAQETTKESVHVITKKPARTITKDPAQEIMRESAPVITTKPVQGTTKDSAQVITKKSAHTITKEPAQRITKESAPVITKKPVQAIAKESARSFAIEPVRPMDQQITSTPPTRRGFHFSFKSPEGKKDSAPIITQYYPKRIVYPFARVDRHIDSRLMQAATIAQERAHAHSRSRCWRYVKDALLASGVIDSRPKTELARDAAQELVSNYGFKKLSVTDPFAAPLGSVLVYGTTRSVGHVELRTRDGFVSDFRSPTPSHRPLVGVYAKL